MVVRTDPAGFDRIRELREYLRKNPEDWSARLAYSDALEESGTTRNRNLAAKQRRIVAQATRPGDRCICLIDQGLLDIYTVSLLIAVRARDGFLRWIVFKHISYDQDRDQATRSAMTEAERIGIPLIPDALPGLPCP